MAKILIIASHPDDEILGCGATVARLIKEGAEGHALILGEGVTSRWENGTKYRNENELIKLQSQCKLANDLIGIKNVEFFYLQDNKFDSISLLDIIKIIEKIINIIKPNIIFTHFRNDLNIDHRITYQAVITATRPMGDCPVKEIYSFEVPSSTEWAFPTSFSPNVFYDVGKTIDLKLEAMNCYFSELREYPHPRSSLGLMTNASYWGMKIGCKYAEAFEAVRILR